MVTLFHCQALLRTTSAIVSMRNTDVGERGTLGSSTGLVSKQEESGASPLGPWYISEVQASTALSHQSARTATQWVRTWSLLSLQRCEDVVLPEDHRKGVLQSKEIVDYNITMQLC